MNLPGNSTLPVRLQAVTGLALAGFVALHLLNTWSGMLGPDVYDAVQTRLRPVYQLPVIEWMLALCLLVHAGLGLLRRPWRRVGSTTPTRPRWHARTGLFLAVCVGGHVLAVRFPSLLYGYFPGAEGIAYSLQTVPGFFYPYYFMLALAGFTHAAGGVRNAIGRLTPMRPGVGFPGPLALGGAAFATAAALLVLGAGAFDSDREWIRWYVEATGRLTPW